MCHSSGDKEFVRRLAGDLQSQEVTVWFDEWQIRVGDSIHDKINEGIKDSAWLIIVLSKKSVESSWVKKELNAGFVRELEERRVVILPILLEQCAIPLMLRDKRYADFSESYDDGFIDLLTTILPKPNRKVIELKGHLLHAVAEGMPIGEDDFRAIHGAIHALQNRLGLTASTFPRAKAGDPLTARHLNQISESITNLREQIGLDSHWEHFPVKSGDPVTTVMFNEMLGKINQATRYIMRVEARGEKK